MGERRFQRCHRGYGDGGKETRVGYVSKSLDIWVSKRVTEAVALAETGKTMRLKRFGGLDPTCMFTHA